MKQLCLILLMIVPSTLNAQVFSGGGGGGGNGRHSSAAGGSLQLGLRSVNKFPEAETLGYSYAIENGTKILYLVCFKNPDQVEELNARSYMNKTSVKNSTGSIRQSGRIGSTDVEVAYSVEPGGDENPIEKTFAIGGAEYDLTKGQVFIVSGTDDAISIQQFELEIEDPKHVEAWIEMIRTLQKRQERKAPGDEAPIQNGEA